MTEIWLAQCIRIWRKRSRGRTLRGPSILHRTRMNLTGAVRSLEGIASTHPIRSAPVCRFILCLRHAKPVDAMVSVQILFHALSCHKYLASLHSPPPSFVRLTVGCTSVSKKNSLDISFFDNFLPLPFLPFNLPLMAENGQFAHRSYTVP